MNALSLHRLASIPRHWLWATWLFVPSIFTAVFIAGNSQRSVVFPQWGLLELLAIALVLTTAATDLCWRKIPNWATYSAAIWGILLNGLASWKNTPEAFSALGAVGFPESVLGLVTLFLVMLMVFRITGGGAGDVKLAGALGAILGLERGIDAALLSYIVAGVFSLGWAIARFGVARVMGAMFRQTGNFLFPIWVAPPNENDRALIHAPMPLAPFFAAGTLLTLAKVQEWL